MKKVLMALAFAALSVPSFAQTSSGGFSLDEEHLYYGVRIGLNVSGISGDNIRKYPDSKAGMVFGGVIGLRLSNNSPVFLESGLYYSEKGGKKGKDKVSLNYLELPILIKYGFKVSEDISVIPFLGPYFSMAISGKVKEYNSETDTFDNHSSFDDGWYRHPDMGFKLGCGAEYSNLYLEMGYQFGIADISDNDSYSAHGHNFFLNFGVNF